VNPWARAALLVAVVLFLSLFVGLALVDVGLELTGRRPIGQRVQRWGRRHALLGGGMVLVLGALTAHFFWQS
jgi:hypothetical protein